MRNTKITRIIVFAILAVVAVVFIPAEINTFVGSTSNVVNPKVSTVYVEKPKVSANERFIAHAGGIIDGYEGSNSLEALQSSVDRGYTLIEVDFLITFDGQVVLGHDWQYMLNRVPLVRSSSEESAIVTHSEYMSYKIFNQYTPVDLKVLIEFLDKNPSVRIITDTKQTYYALKIIAEKFSKHVNRFIPQIYAFEDFKEIYDLGFKDIIVTLYQMPLGVKSSASTIATNAMQYKFFAVTISDELLYSNEYISQLNTNKINYYVHTINSEERAKELLGMGFKGIYTDYLVPDDDAVGLCYNLNEEYLEFLDDRIQVINENSLPSFQDYSIYRINDPIYINKGVAKRVNASNISSVFQEAGTKDIYLPLSHVYEFFGATQYKWHPEDRTITFMYKEVTYTIDPILKKYKKTKNNITEELRLPNAATVYRDMAYVPKEFIESVFSGNVLMLNDLIVVTPDKTTKSIIPEIVYNSL